MKLSSLNKYTQVFVLGKPLQPSISFACKAGSLTLNGVPQMLSGLTNIRLGCKGLPGTNSLAYLSEASVRKIKFNDIDTWAFFELGLRVVQPPK